jgi:hypothetical protein
MIDRGLLVLVSLVNDMAKQGIDVRQKTMCRSGSAHLVPTFMAERTNSAQPTRAGFDPIQTMLKRLDLPNGERCLPILFLG